MKEWRVKSTVTFGTFVVFGVNEEAARRFMHKGQLGNNPPPSADDPPTKGKQLQSRPEGTQGDDTTWTDEAH